MKASLSLFGTCVADNIFYYMGMAGKNEFLIRNRWFQVNPVSLVTGAAIHGLRDFQPRDGWHMKVTSAEMDIRKDFAERIQKKKADYLVMDLTSCDFELLEIREKNASEAGYLSWRFGVASNNAQEIYRILREQGATYSVKQMKALEGVVNFEEAIGKWLRILLSAYDEDRIILIDASLARYGIRLDKTYDIFYEGPAVNPYWDRAFRVIKDRAPGCHIISRLPLVLADAGHFMNVGALHYHEKYYEYLYRAIEIITDRSDRTQEQERLQALAAEYTGIMDGIRERGVEELMRKWRRERMTVSYALMLERNLIGGGISYLEKLRSFYQIDVAAPLSVAYEVKNLNEYVECIVREARGYVLFLAVCNSVGGAWEDFKTRSCLGLKVDLAKKNRVSYAAVVDVEEQIVWEKCDGSGKTQSLRMFVEGDKVRSLRPDADSMSVFGGQREVKRQGEAVEVRNGNGWMADVSSQAFFFDSKTAVCNCWARILLNNIDYAMNRRGLNVVVFGKREGCVLDSFCVDFLGESRLGILR